MKDDLKQILLVITCFHFVVILMSCWSIIGEYKNLPDYLSATKNVQRGYAFFVEIDPHVKSTDYVYDICDSNESCLCTTHGGGNITRFAPENYLGCKYVCYYDPLNPCDYYICFDSLIVESNPIYNTIGYIKHISLGDNDVATITIRWKSDSGRWKWIEQAVSSTEVDRYKSCKKEGRPVTMVVYKTDGGHLAQAL